jgi:hypothetical protein
LKDQCSTLYPSKIFYIGYDDIAIEDTWVRADGELPNMLKSAKPSYWGTIDNHSNDNCVSMGSWESWKLTDLPCSRYHQSICKKTRPPCSSPVWTITNFVVVRVKTPLPYVI